MKFKFQSTDDESGTTITHEFEAFTWYSALDHFVKFLRGSGYGLQNHSVGINEAAGHLFLDNYDDYGNITFFDQEKE